MYSVSYHLDPEGITVPYGAIFDEVRSNFGFVDLRGRADLVADLPEVASSAALRRLLSSLAAPTSQIFSIGCDLGEHQEDEAPRELRRVAGGYVQLMSSNYFEADDETYRTIGEHVGRRLEDASVGHSWEVRVSLQKVAFKLDAAGIRSSLVFWFYASAAKPQKARSSREVLIDRLHRALTE
jgi:hypothetical protein